MYIVSSIHRLNVSLDVLCYELKVFTKNISDLSEITNHMSNKIKKLQYDNDVLRLDIEEVKVRMKNRCGE